MTDLSRRSLLSTSTRALAAGAVLAGLSARMGAAESASTVELPFGEPGEKEWVNPGQPGTDYTPVVVPNGAVLPWKIVAGVKVFHLIAEEVPNHEFAPGLTAACWGFNGQVHGPVIEAVEGDRIRIYLTNKLPAATSVHWHGVILPSGMDGVGGLSQKAIQPGETYVYEWTFRQHGTLMYHSHHDEMTQMALGMTGMIVVHPRKAVGPKIDRDFVLMLHEWKIVAGTRRPDPNEMTDFNVLTINAKVFPATAPLVCKFGDRVRIRLGNLGAMDHHPFHIHGLHFKVTATDGGQIEEAGQWPQTTVLVAVGSTRDIQFIANNPGDWAAHCHMTHHVMTQMGHGLPNLIGIKTDGLDSKIRKLVPGYMTMGDTGMGDMGDMGMKVPPNSLPMVGGKGPKDYITMGGMFTIVKIRKDIASYDDPGWYDDPPGTLAIAATPQQLFRDGISL